MAGHSANGMGLRRRRLRLGLRLRATAARAAAADPGGPRRDSESDGHHRLAAGTRRAGVGDGGEFGTKHDCDRLWWTIPWAEKWGRDLSYRDGPGPGPTNLNHDD